MTTEMIADAACRPRTRQLGLLAAVAFGVCLMTATWGAARAMADFGVSSFAAEAQKSDGSEETQAGAHPYQAITSFTFNTVRVNGFQTFADEHVRTIVVDLPAGFVGDPKAAPTCSRFDLNGAGVSGVTRCPVSSQVGTITLTVSPLGFLNTTTVGIYNVVPTKGELADFGFRFQGTPVHIMISDRTDGDYGVRATIPHVSQAIPVITSKLILWGHPSDPSHDVLRGPELQCYDEPDGPGCADPSTSGGGQPSTADSKAFLTNPVLCTPAATNLTVDSWEHQGDFRSWSAVSSPVSGCDGLQFQPAMTVTPDSSVPDSPTGLAVELSFPQNDNPSGFATPALKDAKVALPEGMTISPSSADGLKGCTDRQLGLGTNDPVLCPDAAKIGTVEADSPVLDEKLSGGIYVGEQKSNDPESGDMFRIFLVLESKERGLLIKLPGKIRADTQTGRLETTFDDNPQLPVSRISLRFRGGSRAPLANPATCGTKTTTAQLSSWGGQVANVSDSFTIDCPGIGGFAPSFDAGTINPVAASFSPFALRLDRADGQEYIDGLTVELPPGLLAKVKDVPLCADADAAGGTCPLETRVGMATVGAGPGTDPFFLQGPVALTGPYKGAPYGLSVAVRAVAGPFDLGTVVIRQAIFVNPTDAHISVVSDPLPTILKGVPLRLRSVDVDIDRPGFMVNPTSCAAKQITATLHSQQGSSAAVVSRFQVGDCQALPLSPAVRLKLTNRAQTTDGKHPGLDVTLTQPAGQANLKGVAVKLPLSLALDPNNAEALCEYADGLSVKCPKTSEIGTAVAVSPLLNRPLYGKVYFVKGIRFNSKGQAIRTLPTLLIPLRGEISLDLRATSDVIGGKLITTFAAIPDAAISSFRLQLNGGKHGILVVTHHQNICSQKQISDVQSDGQNGKQHDFAVTMQTPCKTASTKPRVGKASVRGHTIRVTVTAPQAGTLTARGAAAELGTVRRRSPRRER